MPTSEELISSLITEASALTQSIKSYKTNLDSQVATAISDMKTSADTRVSAAITAITNAANVINVYVDAVNGLDTNAGTFAAPLKTIKFALSLSVAYKSLRIYLKTGQTHFITERLNLITDTLFTSYAGNGVLAKRWNDSVENGAPGGAAGVFANSPTYISSQAIIEFKPTRLSTLLTDYPDPSVMTETIGALYTCPLNPGGTGVYTDITIAFSYVVVKCVDWVAAGIPATYYTKWGGSHAGLLRRRDSLCAYTLIAENSVFWMGQQPLFVLASGIQKASFEMYNNLMIFEKNWKIDKVAEGMYMIDNQGAKPVYLYASNSNYYRDGTQISGTESYHTRYIARPAWHSQIVSGATISKSTDAYNILSNMVFNIDYNTAGNAIIDSYRA